MKKSLLILCLLLTSCGTPAIQDKLTESSTTVPSTTAPSTETSSVNSPGTDALMSLMKEKDAQHYQESVSNNVQFLPTADGNSFYAFWTPDGFDASKDGFIVSLGGHDTFASDDFNAWAPYLKEHNYGLLAVQWWFGSGEDTADYYTPDQIYPQIQAALTEQGIPGGRILFHGFSRGSANSYAVEALDHTQKNPLFLLTISNSGSMATGYPPNEEILQGKFGSKPYEGQHWIFYCGDKDDTANDTCSDMKKTESTVENLGAIVDVFIEDPTGDHGGFHMHSQNAEAALSDYEKLLQE